MTALRAAGRPQQAEAFLADRSALARLRAAAAFVDDQDVRLRHRARQSVRRWGFTVDRQRRTPTEVAELLQRARHLLGDDVPPWRTGGAGGRT